MCAVVRLCGCGMVAVCGCGMAAVCGCHLAAVCGCHLVAVAVVWRLPSGGCVRLCGGCHLAAVCGCLAAVAVVWRMWRLSGGCGGCLWRQGLWLWRRVLVGAADGGGLLDAFERESGVRMRGLGGDFRTEDDLE
jgi:hypothetical protein